MPRMSSQWRETLRWRTFCHLPRAFCQGGKSAGPATGHQARRVSLPAFSGSPLRSVLTHRSAVSLPRKRGGLCRSAGRVSFRRGCLHNGGRRFVGGHFATCRVRFAESAGPQGRQLVAKRGGFRCRRFPARHDGRFDTPLSCVLAAEAGAGYAGAPGG